MMRFALQILVSLALLSPAGAQQRRGSAPPPAPPAKEEPIVEPPPASYEPELLRLAEVLGTLSFMTTLCNQTGSASWAQRMAQLVEAEGTTVQRKERLAGAYNRGFLGHQATHRTCTDRSRLVVDQMLQQGQKLTRELASRYSG